MTNEELDAMVSRLTVKGNIEKTCGADDSLYREAADAITALRAEREAMKQQLELAIMACREIDDLVMHGNRDTDSLALGIMRAHTPARAALGK